MKKTFKEKSLTFFHVLVKRLLFRFLSDKQFIIWDYFIFLHKFPNLNNPKTFSEKIQWIKLNGGLEKYTKYVDKLSVRNFIEKTIGIEYLIPLLGVWNNFDEIDFNNLPNQFVLKATHGSHYIYICKDKKLLDKHKLKKTVSKWLKENFYIKTRETQYKNCKPKILCEKYLKDYSGSLTDYKMFCFNGKPYCIEVISDRFSDEKDDIMDLNWKIMPLIYKNMNHSIRKLQKPEKLNEMIEISKKLAKEFPFVRVDLYTVENKIYFGELTFTPANGLEEIDPIEAEYLIGEMIDLSKYDRNSSSKLIHTIH
jgi:hypothetical protein